MQVPRCCGMDMKIRMETMRFIEAECQKCGDVVYIKKGAEIKPQLIDD